MKTIIHFLSLLLLQISFDLSAENIGKNEALVILKQINKKFESKKLYVKAMAYSYSASDMNKSSDEGEMEFGISGSSMTQKFKDMLTVVESGKTLQIDTFEKSMILGQSGDKLKAVIDTGLLRGCKSIVLTRIGGTKLKLSLRMKENFETELLEYEFDSTNYVLNKIVTYYNEYGYNMTVNEVKKMEINYLEIKNEIPNEFEMLQISDFVKSEKGEFQIVNKNYKNYSIIGKIEL